MADLVHLHEVCLVVYVNVSSYHDIKSLKIPKMQSVARNERKTDNIMGKKKKNTIINDPQNSTLKTKQTTTRTSQTKPGINAGVPGV